MKKENSKDIIAASPQSLPVPGSTLWFGLKLDHRIESINGLSLFFELRNVQFDREFYQSLSKGVWTINGHPVKAQMGANPDTGSARDEMDNMIKQEMQVCTKICNHVNAFYQERFITFSNGSFKMEQLSAAGQIPMDLAERFSRDDLGELERNLCWVRVDLQEAFQPDILEEVSCSFSAVHDLKLEIG